MFDAADLTLEMFLNNLGPAYAAHIPKLCIERQVTFKQLLSMVISDERGEQLRKNFGIPIEEARYICQNAAAMNRHKEHKEERKKAHAAVEKAKEGIGDAKTDAIQVETKTIGLTLQSQNKRTAERSQTPVRLGQVIERAQQTRVGTLSYLMAEGRKSLRESIKATLDPTSPSARRYDWVNFEEPPRKIYNNKGEVKPKTAEEIQAEREKMPLLERRLLEKKEEEERVKAEKQAKALKEAIEAEIPPPLPDEFPEWPLYRPPEACPPPPKRCLFSSVDLMIHPWCIAAMTAI